MTVTDFTGSFIFVAPIIVLIVIINNLMFLKELFDLFANTIFGKQTMTVRSIKKFGRFHHQMFNVS